jgi:hypothetical protein
MGGYRTASWPRTARVAATRIWPQNGELLALGRGSSSPQLTSCQWPQQRREWPTPPSRSVTNRRSTTALLAAICVAHGTTAIIISGMQIGLL